MDSRKGVETITTSSGEKIDIKKSGWFGWGIIHSWRNEDGSFNWFNFLTGGSWIKLIIVIIIVASILLAISEYYSNLRIASACLRALPDYIDLKMYLDNPTLVNNLTNIKW